MRINATILFKEKRSCGKRLLNILKKEGHESFIQSADTWLGETSHYEIDRRTGFEYYTIKNHSKYQDENNFRCFMVYILGKVVINYRKYYK